jgi:FMN phosphatase YigB (HAD superfamily)
VAVSFDLFGTLVDVETSADPAAAVGRELRERGVAVPDDWAAAYGESHVDAPDGAEVPLPAHVARALGSRGVEPAGNAARRAVVAAFDPEVERRPGVEAALSAARGRVPVGLLSNCSVPELVRRTLVRADLRGEVDAVVTSGSCGWRKPDERAFETLARRLDVAAEDLVHVGDSDADAGVEGVGGTFVDVRDVPLTDLPDRLEG